MGQTVTLVKQGGDPTLSSLIVNGPTNLSGSLYTRSNLNVSGSIFTSGSLIVSGSIIAQTLVINTTIYSSGSNIFGNSPSNTQVFTGSMYVGGLISGSVFYGSGANLTQIPNSALTNSTISGIALGSNLGTLTFGTYLTGTSYNGSTGVTIATNATNANTVSTIVARDASGNFSAGTITAALTGNASTATAVVATVTGTNSTELVRGNMADNDQFRILVGGTATNAGYVEIATADDGTEPIHVRQYTGVFSSLTRTATLLDGSGNTSFPGTVTAPTFSGALSGNASTATTAVNLNGLGAIQSTSTGTSYTVNYQVRENSGGSGNTNEIYAPQLAFHWASVVASSIMMEASGRIAIRNNPGTSYENFIANVIYANSSFQGNLTGNVTGDVSGNASTATTATYLNSAQSSTDVTNISSRINSGFFQDSATQDHTGWPSGASSWYHLISSTHSNPSNYYALQFAAPFFAQGVYTRNTNNNGTQAWALILTTSNYNSYSPTLTGTGASGTWGIDITGNSATTSQRSFSGDFSISGTSNTPLSIDATEPYMNIVANGGSNVAGLRIYPTTNYDAYIGNYRGAGKLWLIAGNADNAYVDSAGSLFNRTGTYGTISDITLKENIINTTPKLQDLLKLKVRNFNFIGKDEKLLGFIAQEFEEVFPNAINTDTGFGDMNGKKVVKTTVLIPMLVKAIQEQQTLITELQEKLERNNIT
jgi:hypothetical protein